MFWIVATFLALMSAAFTVYSTLILQEFGISYGHYGARFCPASPACASARCT